MVNRIIPMAVGVIIIVGGILLIPTAAIVADKTPVTAVPVQATVLEDTTTPPPERCGGMTATGMLVQFAWNGSTTTQTYYPPCGRHYLRGETFTAYAASDDPSDLADTATAITDPSTVNPFAVFGPNDQGFLLALWVLCAFFGGAGLVLAGIFAKPRAALLPGAGTPFRPAVPPEPGEGPGTPLFPRPRG